MHILSIFEFIFITVEIVEVTQGQDDRQLECDGVMEPGTSLDTSPGLASLVTISQRHSSVSRVTWQHRTSGHGVTS